MLSNFPVAVIRIATVIAVLCCRTQFSSGFDKVGQHGTGKTGGLLSFDARGEIDARLRGHDSILSTHADE